MTSGQDASTLFESCLESDDALVRVAAAVGQWELDLHGAGLLEVLATGATSDDEEVAESGCSEAGWASPSSPPASQRLSSRAEGRRA